MLTHVLIPISPFKLIKLFRFLSLVQKKELNKIAKLADYFFHPDYTCYVGGNGRISGVYRGWKEYCDKIVLGEISTPAKLVTIVTNNQYVNLITRLKGEREGKKLDLQVSFLFRFSGGKIIEQRSIPFDDYAWDQFWA